MKIVTGKTGTPHVTSQEFRQFAEGTVGQESYILASGENLEPELSTNNMLKIRSGMMSHHGNISCVELGTYDEVTIRNGNQGMKRIDLVVNRYSKNDETGLEENNWVVIMGAPSEDNPAAPAYTEGNLQEGDLVDDCPVFEVHLDGINVTEVKKLLSVTPDMSTLNAYLAELSGNLYEDLTQYYTVNWAWEFDRLEVIRTGRLVHIAFICHPKNSWSADQIYTVFTSKIPNKYKPRDLIYSLGVKMNGDATDVNNCAFIANPNGSIQIAVGDKVTSGYFLCDMTYTCVWDS